MKDPKGNSILKICCQKLFEEDNSFHKFKEDFPEIYGSLKLSVEDLQSRTEKLGTESKRTK